MYLVLLKEVEPRAPEPRPHSTRLLAQRRGYTTRAQQTQSHTSWSGANNDTPWDLLCGDRVAFVARSHNALGVVLCNVRALDDWLE